MRGRWLFLLCLALMAGQAAPAQAERPACRPAWGVALEGLPNALDLARVQAQTGLRPRLVVFFLMWPPPGQKQAFPQAALQAIHAAGATPVITWEPMYLDEEGRERTILHDQVSRGEYDGYLLEFARACRAWGRPLIIRFGHEMNLARYHWGVAAEQYGPAAPAAYQRMFRQVVRAFRRAGADKALFAFCPNAESNPHPQWHGAPWNRAAAYYPGHDYVDILGMDGYNWGASQGRAEKGWDSRWQSFAEIFGPLRDELQALAPDKPLVVFETASARAGGDRARWVGEAREVMARWRAAAWVWFQVNKEIDWRLMPEADAGALKVLRAGDACAGPWLPEP